MVAHNLVRPEGFEPTPLGSEDRISANLKLFLPPNAKHGLGPLRSGKSRLAHRFGPVGDASISRLYRYR